MSFGWCETGGMNHANGGQSEDEQRANLLGLEYAEDENDEDQRESSFHDTSRLAADDNDRKASVSLAFLLILTCGVAG